jgi:predicted transcriptional regulator of viral defense system
MDKTIVQRVFEYVSSQGREVTTREVLRAFAEVKASAITFSLSRLARSGELQRTAHGRYAVPHRSETEAVPPLLEDAYLMHILERVRPVLEFAELAYLYGALDVARTSVPSSLARLAQARAKKLL